MRYISPILILFLTAGFGQAHNLESQLKKADRLWKRAYYDRAFLQYKKIVQKDPGEAKYYAHAARAYCHMYSVHRAPLDTVSREDSIRLRVYLERARQLARETVQMAPDNDLGYAVIFVSGLALAQLEPSNRQRHRNQAIEALNQLAPLEKKYAYSWHAMGLYHRIYADFGWETRAYLNLKYDLPPGGTYKDAIRCYREANLLAPRQFNYLFMLARLYQREGNRNRSLMYAKLILSHSARSEYDEVFHERALQLLDVLEKA